MKSLFNFSKLAIILSFVLLSIRVHSQPSSKSYKGFLRVYSQTGQMISKGQFVFINDSVLGIKRLKEVSTINKSVIGFVKTKRSGGHNVVIGAAAGGAIGIALGVGTADPDSWFGYSAGEGALGFGILGALGGGLIGGLAGLVKEPMVFMINGNEGNWQTFKNVMVHFKK
ncbi:hypothetical protein [Gaetbulibacter aestuarii]|uniref:Glycine zipper family protein n=1 Tax=Gaetbulibacter aestuarii TaxID=1502358 RepID=A0ABW7MYJ1_9FLAO